MEFFWQKKRRLRIEAEKKKADEERRAQQSSIGWILVTTMRKAARDNTVYNLYEDGQREETISPIVVTPMPQNGQKFTILTTLPSTTCFSISCGMRGYPVDQVDIDISKHGKELHLLHGPYGPEFYWDISKLDEFKELIYKRTKEYSLFPKEKAM